MGTNFTQSITEAKCTSDNVTAEQLGAGVAFKRVRRITGYLSDETAFNNAKRAELHDRVSHASVCC